MLLDALARRYGTDPGSVLTWDPFRLGLALECQAAGAAFADQRMGQINRGGGAVHAAFVVGGL